MGQDKWRTRTHVRQDKRGTRQMWDMTNVGQDKCKTRTKEDRLKCT